MVTSPLQRDGGAENGILLVLTVAFNGAAYGGYQAQLNAPTIQRELNKALYGALGFECRVTGCSRTDAGVHAYGFVAAVTPSDKTEEKYWWRIPREKLAAVLNRYLPCDIAVREIRFADAGFHPRYDVQYKEYVYKIDDGGLRDPFTDGLVYEYRRGRLDEAAMNEAAARFTGTYDFKAFMAAGGDAENTVRTVKYAEVVRNGGIVEFIVAADGFLYNMVRIMTGTLLDAGRGKIKPDDIDAIIASRDRKNAGATAPPHGLYLSRAVYPEGMLRREP